MDEILTVRQAATTLSVHTNTIYRWLNSKKLQGYRLPTGDDKAGDWRILEKDIMAILFHGGPK